MRDDYSVIYMSMKSIRALVMSKLLGTELRGKIESLVQFRSEYSLHIFIEYDENSNIVGKDIEERAAKLTF